MYGTDGTAYSAYTPSRAVALATRAPGSADWVKELVDWGAEGAFVKLDPDGIPGIIYVSYRSTNPNGKSLNFARPKP
jgi:hypothetical protein